ncbi:hypothetical protein [Streptomyces sp. G1]|uniref:hypothetical protein n=1 Tax=Streptomyces sp. G1 TaxID=361572 RepID=UPI00202E44F1|nr:hypothetical protein [Streptomyces sp. G1]MCM1964891.1 hypothetical protein [Streptomyces sp. G1]
MNRPQSFRVPDGRVQGLNRLRDRLAAAGRMTSELSHTSHTDEFRALAEELRAAYEVANLLAGGLTATGCKQHPKGAVDPEAPAGWGACLICNARRRVGEVQARNLSGQRMPGATAAVNRPAQRVEAALLPSEYGAARWREPAPEPELDSPILAARRANQNPTYSAAVRRARAERAARKQQ